MIRHTLPLGARLGAVAALASVVLVGCGGPVGPLAGGRLAGTVAGPPVADWSFADAHRLMEIEVRPERPYSVQIHHYVVARRLYFEGAPGGWGRWRRYLRADRRIRVRFGGHVHAAQAVEVTDPQEVAAILPAYLAKEGEQPSAACTASWQATDCGFNGIFFRVEGRTS
jgi:hypothetical protein